MNEEAKALVERLRNEAEVERHYDDFQFNTLSEAADLIEQLEREKAVVSDLWEQQKEIALGYLADCNKAADRIAALEAENRDQHNDILNRIKRELDKADRIAALEAKNERLRLAVEAQEALQVSAYHAGLRAGWNFGVSDDNAGMQAALANTDHIKELRRIREARAALAKIKDATDG